jgi:hypothetical protein
MNSALVEPAPDAEEKHTSISRSEEHTTVGVWEARPSGSRLLEILRARFLCTSPRYGSVAQRSDSAPPFLALIEQV